MARPGRALACRPTSCWFRFSTGGCWISRRFDRLDLYLTTRNKFCTSGADAGADESGDPGALAGGSFAELYGMTEGGVGTTLRAHEHPGKLDTVGVVNPGSRDARHRRGGKRAAAGSVGELVGRSPSMMSGYHGRENETREASWLDAGGQRFQRSGDIGWFDAEGFLHLLDRKKDVIISGGFNVYAIDLENVLMQHPDVAEVAVIATPSREWGETPVAFAVLRNGAGTDVVRQWANDRLGKSQRIARVIAIDALPRSSIGKVLKRELRERFKGMPS